MAGRAGTLLLKAKVLKKQAQSAVAAQDYQKACELMVKLAKAQEAVKEAERWGQIEEIETRAEDELGRGEPALSIASCEEALALAQAAAEVGDGASDGALVGRLRELQAKGTRRQEAQRLRELAEHEVGAGDFEGALSSYGQCLVLDPEDAAGRLGRDTCAQQLERARDAAQKQEAIKEQAKAEAQARAAAQEHARVEALVQAQAQAQAAAQEKARAEELARAQAEAEAASARGPTQEVVESSQTQQVVEHTADTSQHLSPQQPGPMTEHSSSVGRAWTAGPTMGHTGAAAPHDYTHGAQHPHQHQPGVPASPGRGQMLVAGAGAGGDSHHTGQASPVMRGTAPWASPHPASTTGPQRGQTQAHPQHGAYADGRGSRAVGVQEGGHHTDQALRDAELLFAQKLASAMESSARGPIDSFASTASPLGTTHSAPSPDGQSSWRYEQRPFSPSSRSHYRRRRHHHHHHHSRRFAAVAADEEEGAVAIDGGGWSEHERAVATATIARQERQLLRLSSQNLQLTIDLEASRRANQRLREDFDAEIDSSRRLHNRLSEVMSVAPDATRTMATSPHEAEPPLWRELESEQLPPPVEWRARSPLQRRASTQWRRDGQASGWRASPTRRQQQHIAAPDRFTEAPQGVSISSGRTPQRRPASARQPISRGTSSAVVGRRSSPPPSAPAVHQQGEGESLRYYLSQLAQEADSRSRWDPPHQPRSLSRSRPSSRLAAGGARAGSVGDATGAALGGSSAALRFSVPGGMRNWEEYTRRSTGRGSRGGDKAVRGNGAGWEERHNSRRIAQSPRRRMAPPPRP